MSSTYVDWRDAGFEASDSTLAVWLHLLVHEIDKQPVRTAWLQSVRDEWHLQSQAGFDFGVMPGLDRFVTDDTKRVTLVTLSQQTLRKLQQHGDAFSKEELNAMHVGGDGSFLNDVPTEAFARVGRYFVKLLQGELRPDENDARMWADEKVAEKAA